MNANAPRAYAYQARTRRSRARSQPAHDPAHDADGRLSPWANPAVGTPGWQLTTRSRRLAVAAAAAICGATIHSHEKGEWQTRLPETALAVVAIGADAGALWCRLSARPALGVFTLAFAPWPAAMVLRCPLTALPAQGQLSVRDVRVTTRMGRTVRYLIPVFTAS